MVNSFVLYTLNPKSWSDGNRLNYLKLGEEMSLELNVIVMSFSTKYIIFFLLRNILNFSWYMYMTPKLKWVIGFFFRQRVIGLWVDSAGTIGSDWHFLNIHVTHSIINHVTSYVDLRPNIINNGFSAWILAFLVEPMDSIFHLLYFQFSQRYLKPKNKSRRWNIVELT